MMRSSTVRLAHSLVGSFRAGLAARIATFLSRIARVCSRVTAATWRAAAFVDTGRVTGYAANVTGYAANDSPRSREGEAEAGEDAQVAVERGARHEDQ